jgi:hypothetical protein
MVDWRARIDDLAFLLSRQYSHHQAVEPLRSPLSSVISSSSSLDLKLFWLGPVVASRYLPTIQSGAYKDAPARTWVEVGEILDKVPLGAWDGGFAPSFDPARGDYNSFAKFSHPDGNS